MKTCEAPAALLSGVLSDCRSQVCFFFVFCVSCICTRSLSGWLNENKKILPGFCQVLIDLTFQTKFQFFWNLVRKILLKRPSGIYSEKYDRTHLSSLLLRLCPNSGQGCVNTPLITPLHIAGDVSRETCGLCSRPIRGGRDK